jgi:hypothetical protein
LDVREEKCYTDFKHGSGVNPLDGIYPKCICCCSTIGKAWGGGIEGSLGRSETCPRRGTPAFTELCPKVSNNVLLFTAVQLRIHFNLYRDPVLSIAKISTNVLSFLVYAVTAGARTPWEVLRVNVVKDTLWTNLESVVLVRKLILSFKHVPVHVKFD